MNNDFIWTDTTVSEFAEWYRQEQGKNIDLWGKDMLEEYKRQKSTTVDEGGYEVLEIIAEYAGKECVCFTPYEDSRFGSKIVANKPELRYLLTCCDGVIRSVRRLSDNSIFTKGEHTEDGVITAFILSGNEMKVRLEQKQGEHRTLGITTTLGALKKVKPVLFITEDGKSVVEGDRVWWINAEEYYGVNICDAKDAAETGQVNDRTLKHFSTDQAAKEYVLFNLHLLSLEDLLSVWGNVGEGKGNAREMYKEAPLFKLFKAIAEKNLNNK